MVISRSWVYLTLPVALIAIGLLTWTALSLLRTVRRAVVMSLPIAREQEISFNEAGEYSLNLETGSLKSAPTDLQFGLRAANGGAQVSLHRAVFRTKVSSFSRARLELSTFSLPSAGKYLLSIDGPETSRLNNDVNIVITRPIGGPLVSYVLALVFVGVCLIGALVVSGLALARTPLSSN